MWVGQVMNCIYRLSASIQLLGLHIGPRTAKRGRSCFPGAGTHYESKQRHIKVAGALVEGFAAVRESSAQRLQEDPALG
jgi:hypothetical protein